MENKDGGRAFPESHPECPNPSRGMTLRQWYAGMAMNGELASQGEADFSIDKTVKRCFEFADAMIKHEASK